MITFKGRLFWAKKEVEIHLNLKFDFLKPFAYTDRIPSDYTNTSTQILLEFYLN